MRLSKFPECCVANSSSNLAGCVKHNYVADGSQSKPYQRSSGGFRAHVLDSRRCKTSDVLETGGVPNMII